MTLNQLRRAYLAALDKLSEQALAAEMDVLNDGLPVPYYVFSGSELSRLEQRAADGMYSWQDYPPRPDDDDDDESPELAATLDLD